ncbi:MAG TPA: SEC-C metal-binding domain-containing protein, partial [Bryobacteraceae bacterium]|nr:SEC-C metal-binding domain-containing protein [Bryobacteraceae bacterium]
LLRDLTPEGVLESTFAAEIMGAAWRLRRCGLIESAFDMIEDETLLEKQQRSVDRARSQSHNILRKSITELRKLQTERKIRIELDIEDACGLADNKIVLNAIKLRAAVCGSPDTDDEQCATPPDAAPGEDPGIRESEAMLRRELGFTDLPALPHDFDASAPSSFCKPEPEPAAPVSSFCKPAGTTRAVSSKIPRNAACPCRSGLKFKKCCGGPAAQEAQKAACPPLNSSIPECAKRRTPVVCLR